MKADKFTIQPYAGGEEREFFNRLPFQRRAEIELQTDPAYRKLGKFEKNMVVSVGMCILAARYEGLAGEFDVPDSLTVESCDEFAIKYAITIGSAEIPHDADAETVNPTDTQGETS